MKVMLKRSFDEDDTHMSVGGRLSKIQAPSLGDYVPDMIIRDLERVLMAGHISMCVHISTSRDFQAILVANLEHARNKALQGVPSYTVCSSVKVPNSICVRPTNVVLEAASIVVEADQNYQDRKSF
jgi:hypothetical protein